MKKKMVFLLLIYLLLLCSCEKKTNNDVTDNNATESNVVDNISETEANKEINYEGSYYDEYTGADLKIKKEDDGKYSVQMFIIRLTSLDDGIGEVTPEGLLFTATDSAGNPISALITIEEDITTVTIIDSTWNLLENGTKFKFKR